jgi:hypothetical protein
MDRLGKKETVGERVWAWTMIQRWNCGTVAGLLLSVDTNGESGCDPFMAIVQALLREAGSDAWMAGARGPINPLSGRAYRGWRCLGDGGLSPNRWCFAAGRRLATRGPDQGSAPSAELSGGLLLMKARNRRLLRYSALPLKVSESGLAIRHCCSVGIREGDQSPQSLF